VQPQRRPCFNPCPFPFIVLRRIHAQPATSAIITSSSIRMTTLSFYANRIVSSIYDRRHGTLSNQHGYHFLLSNIATTTPSARCSCFVALAIVHPHYGKNINYSISLSNNQDPFSSHRDAAMCFSALYNVFRTIHWHTHTQMLAQVLRRYTRLKKGEDLENLIHHHRFHLSNERKQQQDGATDNDGDEKRTQKLMLMMSMETIFMTTTTTACLTRITIVPAFD
jgi:hypothetical protein